MHFPFGMGFVTPLAARLWCVQDPSLMYLPAPGVLLGNGAAVEPYPPVFTLTEKT